MSCNDQSLVAVGMPCDAPNIDLGCILDAIIDPATNKPNYEPAPDQLPFAKAPNGLWVWTCENGWILVESDRQLQCINLVTEAPTYTPSSSQPFMAMDAEKGILWFYTCADGWKFVQTQVCIPPTSGEPSWNPTQGFPYYAYDSSESKLWFYVCEQGWQSINPYSLCSLEQTDLSALANLCDVLNIPVTYQFNNECYEQTVTLSILADKIWECLGIVIPPQLTYDCVPFVPSWDENSPAPAEGLGSFVVDCTGSLWVWTCAGEKWIEVPNKFPSAPLITQQEINDIESVCTNAKFYVKYDEDCEKIREINLTQLSQLLDSCGPCKINCDDELVWYTDPTSASGFGICFFANTTTDWIWPDNTVGEGRLQFSITNPTDRAALLDIDMQVHGDAFPNTAGGEGLVLFAHTVGENPNASPPQEGGGNSTVSSNWAFTNVDTRDLRGTNPSPTNGFLYTKESSSLKYNRILAPNEQVTLYALWKVKIQSITGGNITMHGGYRINAKIFRNVGLL